MNNPVLVKENPHNGLVVTMKDSKDAKGKAIKVGTVRVEQLHVSVTRGYVNTSRRSAFLTLGQEQIAALAPMLKKDQPFPIEGKIVITESLTPYVSKAGKTQDPKVYPATHELAGQPVLYQGQPVYMNSSFESDMNAQDFLLREPRTSATPDATGSDTPE